MPKVSVLVPVYNVEAYIERCARSLFCQTLYDVEYIFIDDCTPDQSMTVLNRLIEEYREHISLMQWRVRIERMPNNSGQAAVRRYGMQIAEGDYITFCDSDDWMADSMLEEMWEKAVSEDYDIVVCDVIQTDGNNTKCYCGRKFPDSMPFIKELLLDKTLWSLCNKLFKRSLYADHQLLYPSDGDNMGEDFVITLEMVYYSRKVGYIGKALYNYYENPQSIMHSRSEEKTLRNQIQWVNNINTFGLFLKQRKETRWQSELTYLKYKVKLAMLPTVIYTNHPKIWITFFPELLSLLLFNPYCGKRSKLAYFKYMVLASLKTVFC